MEIMHKGMWTGRRVLYLSVDAIRANPDQPRSDTARAGPSTFPCA